MKKVILIAAVLAAFPVASQAGRGAGCGVGAMLFEGQNGAAPHVLAATTNGSLFDTVSMTFGLVGCDTSVTITAASADEFLKDNMDKVARDMSSGQGEALEALANLLRIENADKAIFYTATQKNFGRIFSREDVSSIEVLVSLVGVMKEDAALSKYLS